jgi:hypothetical protein
MISGYTSDEVKQYHGASNAAIQNKPIKKGIFTKDNHWQYMFLCQNCMTNSTIAFDQKEETVQLTYVVVSPTVVPVG